MNIFTKIKNSIYNPQYYSEVMGKPFSYSLKYYLVFSLLFALVFTIIITIKFIPIVNILSEKAPKLVEYFPKDLVINIKDGKASTNVQEPYFVKISENLKNNNNVNPNSADIKNIIVINTKDKFDVETFMSYKTFMLLTSDSFVYMDNESKITINSLNSIKEFTLNRDKVSSLVNIVKPFFVILYPIAFVGAYLGGFIVAIFKMVYLLFGALLIWLIVKIKGLEIGYKKSYQVGMHLMSSAIIITSILGVFSHRLTFPFLFTIILAISALVNLKRGHTLDTLSKI